MDRIQPTIQTEASTEPREITIAGVEPKGKFDQDLVPIVNKFKLQEFFGMVQPDHIQKEMLDKIYKYFDDSGVQTMDDVFKLINQYEHRLGSVPLGQNRLNHLWNYLKVLSQISQYEQLKQSYEQH